MSAGDGSGVIPEGARNGPAHIILDLLDGAPSGALHQRQYLIFSSVPVVEMPPGIGIVDGRDPRAEPREPGSSGALAPAADTDPEPAVEPAEADQIRGS